MKLIKHLLKHLLRDESGANLVQISIISGLLSAGMLAAVQQNQISMRRAGRNKDIQVAGYVMQRLSVILRDENSCTTSVTGKNPAGNLNLASGIQQLVGGIDDTSAYNEDYPLGDINSHLSIQAMYVHSFTPSTWDNRTGEANLTVIFRKLNVSGSKGTRSFPRTIPIIAYLNAPGGTIESCFQGTLNGPVVSFCRNFGRAGSPVPGPGLGGGTFSGLRCKDLNILRDTPGTPLTIVNNGIQVGGNAYFHNLIVNGDAESAGSDVRILGNLTANNGLRATDTIQFPNIGGAGAIEANQICIYNGVGAYPGNCINSWPADITTCSSNQGTPGWTSPGTCHTMRVFRPRNQSGWQNNCTGGTNVVTGISIGGASVLCSSVSP